MDLTKINKSNIEIMLYKNISNVIKTYKDYTYQKEQLMFLNIMHELAVEYTVELVQTIINLNYKGNHFHYYDYEEDYEEKGKINGVYLTEYNIWDKHIEIQLRTLSKLNPAENYTDTTITIVQDKNKYKVYFDYNEYAMYNNKAILDMYEISIKNSSETKACDVLISSDNSNKSYTLIIDRIDNILYEKSNRVLNIDKIKYKNPRLDYLFGRYSGTLKDKGKLKALLKEYITVENSCFIDNFNNQLESNMTIGKTEMHSNSLVYCLMFDAENVIAMLYDYMIKNIDEYIYNIDEKRKGKVCSTISYSNETGLVSYNLSTHYYMLFDIIKLDVNMLYEYSKTRNIQAILVDGLKKARLLNITFGDLIKIAKPVLFNNSLNVFTKGMLYDDKNGYVPVKINEKSFKKTLDDLVDGKDNILNLLTVIMLLSYNNYSSLDDIVIVDNEKQKEQNIDLAFNSRFLHNKYLSADTKNKLIRYKGDMWDKNNIDALCSLFNKNR